MAKQTQKPADTANADAGLTAANPGAETGGAASAPITQAIPATATAAAPEPLPTGPILYTAMLTRQAMVNGRIRKAGSTVSVGIELLDELKDAGLTH
ncbi:hypothetical protein DFR52_106238 [Hoeflea marina]|uniref:Uncharacterized protein n=1 Tax=Hoeflea marina TaxID=274592 RepID=A0A317PI55_9HYPH|nr:hypothetical protein [Hoeflea marina]PWV97713.1 hypothetical protein DFR52_106238 [Hoeflea marina]